MEARVPVNYTRAVITERIREQTAEMQQRLCAQLAVSQPGGEIFEAHGLGEQRSAFYDGLFSELAPALGPQAIAAVGSYGRRTLALWSDIDIRILVDNMRGGGAEESEALARSLLYPLWDAGLSVGHQVATVEMLLEAAGSDLPTLTSLLDWRYVAGSEEASHRLVTEARRRIFAEGSLEAVMSRLEREREGRHARFGGSVYLLEPDIRNGAGGLRDCAIIGWASKARWGVDDLESMVRVGALLSKEADELARATTMRQRIRNLLHADAGRRADRLTYDAQEAFSERLGFGEGSTGVERMMSEYYRTAAMVTSLLDAVLVRATPVLARRKPAEENLGEGVRSFAGAVTFEDSKVLAADPDLALRLVERAVERKMPLLSYAREFIRRAAGDPAWCAALRADRNAADRFVRLLLSPAGAPLKAGSVARELQELGLLLAMVPEFAPVVGRVHHDTYHVYTVDVHSVAAVDRLHALSRGELVEPSPLASRLAVEVGPSKVLYLATLLHDVGKSIGRRDHSERGAELSALILERLGFSAEERADVASLILHHLRMYQVATRRDLSDPQTVEDFVAVVENARMLRHLYLLTVADVSTTSPTSMSAWKASMLDELFTETDASLRGRPMVDLMREKAIDALRALALARGLDAERCIRFVESMRRRYPISHPPEALLEHATLVERAGDGWAVEVCVSDRHPDTLEVRVVAADAPGLLYQVAAALAACRLAVQMAEVHSRQTEHGHEQAVDFFWVRFPSVDPQEVERARRRLTNVLGDLFAGRVLAADLVSGIASPTHAKRLPAVPGRVNVDHRASARYTVLEISTEDRPGLLFTIAELLFRLGLNIHLAKISTEGARAADVFYVSERDGQKLDPEARSREVLSEIRKHVIASVPRGVEETL